MTDPSEQRCAHVHSKLALQNVIITPTYRVKLRLFTTYMVAVVNFVSRGMDNKRTLVVVNVIKGNKVG